MSNRTKRSQGGGQQEPRSDKAATKRSRGALSVNAKKGAVNKAVNNGSAKGGNG
ncbi:MAG: hypothetical protein ABL986_12910 [Vicinamibacterales bacterium]